MTILATCLFYIHRTGQNNPDVWDPSPAFPLAKVANERDALPGSANIVTFQATSRVDSWILALFSVSLILHLDGTILPSGRDGFLGVALCVPVHVRDPLGVVGHDKLADEAQAQEDDRDAVVGEAQLVHVVEPAVSAPPSAFLPHQTGGVEDGRVDQRVRDGRCETRIGV